MTNKNLDLGDYVDRLIEEKKFPSDLEPEVMAQIKSDLIARVEDRINAVIINNMPEDKLEEFNKMLEGEVKDEDMQAFCSNNIPDLAELIASELILFKQTYLS